MRLRRATTHVGQFVALAAAAAASDASAAANAAGAVRVSHIALHSGPKPP